MRRLALLLCLAVCLGGAAPAADRDGLARSSIARAGTSVMSVEDFEKRIQSQADLRLSVKRMARTRVVEIKMAAPTGKTSKGTGTRPPGPRPNGKEE